MTDAPALEAVRLFVSGRVQGVWFRGWVIESAQRLGLRGWVRNRSDGRVEVLLVGPAAHVEAMAAACRDGPRAARVARVERVAAEAREAGAGFAQRPTL
jgi:acylphosphatase